MINLNTLTGDRKIMNMRKPGMLIQSKTSFKNHLQSIVKPMDSGLRAIHYEYLKDGQGGIVRGMVVHLTYHRIPVKTYQI